MSYVPVVYWASPIDFANPLRGELVDVLDDAHNSFIAAGWAIYNPSGAWTAPPNVERTTSEIARVNLRVLSGCDLLFAVLPEGVRSVGVPLEIGYALGASTQAVALVGDTQSWALPQDATLGSLNVFGIPPEGTSLVPMREKLDKYIQWATDEFEATSEFRLKARREAMWG